MKIVRVLHSDFVLDGWDPWGRGGDQGILTVLQIDDGFLLFRTSINGPATAHIDKATIVTYVNAIGPTYEAMEPARRLWQEFFVARGGDPNYDEDAGETCEAFLAWVVKAHPDVEIHNDPPLTPSVREIATL